MWYKLNSGSVFKFTLIYSPRSAREWMLKGAQNARATIVGKGCELWSETWKNIWRKTARGSTGCQRSTTLQKWIWRWTYYTSELGLSSELTVPILVAPI